MPLYAISLLGLVAAFIGIIVGVTTGDYAVVRAFTGLFLASLLTRLTLGAITAFHGARR